MIHGAEFFYKPRILFSFLNCLINSKTMSTGVVHSPESRIHAVSLVICARLCYVPWHRYTCIENTWYQVYQARLWERLLSQPASLAMSTSVFKALPGKLDVKKNANLVFYLSVYPFFFHSSTRDYDVIFDFCVDSASFATSFKSATSSWPDNSSHMPWDRQRLSGNVQQCS